MKKLLFIRFSSIGDIVLTTPVVRCASRQLDGVEIHYLTKPAFSGILKSNPYINKVHELDNDLQSTIQKLKSERFDFVADLHHNIRSIRVRRGIGAPNAAFPKLNIEKWLLVNLKWNRMPDMHIVDRYFKTVADIGVKNDGAGLDYFIPEMDRVDLNVLPDKHRDGFVAMVIGAQHVTKRMPAHRLNELASKLHLPVVLLGGKDDYEQGEVIVRGNESMVFNACGKFNLNQSASLVRDSRVVITHDTGLMHIAAAFRKRIVSLWGNTAPVFGMTPYLPDGVGESHIFEVQGLGCRPCSKIGFNQCPKSHFKCMQEIVLDDVVSKVHKLF
ncbi:MAG: glycosyltransferase family 9 protein [Bacteroidota bacterium]